MIDPTQDDVGKTVYYRRVTSYRKSKSVETYVERGTIVRTTEHFVFVKFDSSRHPAACYKFNLFWEENK